MSDQETPFSKLKWAVSIGTLIGIANLFGAYFWPSFGRWMVSVFVGAWQWLDTVHSVPGWLIVFFVVTSVLTIMAILATLRGKPKDHWSHYLQDTFYGVVWRWDYTENAVSNLAPYCGACDMAILPRIYPETYTEPSCTQLKCDHCRQELLNEQESYDLIKDKVIRRIERNVRKKNWPEENQTGGL